MAYNLKSPLPNPEVQAKVQVAQQVHGGSCWCGRVVIGAAGDALLFGNWGVNGLGKDGPGAEGIYPWATCRLGVLNWESVRTSSVLRGRLADSPQHKVELWPWDKMGDLGVGEGVSLVQRL